MNDTNRELLTELTQKPFCVVLCVTLLSSCSLVLQNIVCSVVLHNHGLAPRMDWITTNIQHAHGNKSPCVIHLIFYSISALSDTSLTHNTNTLKRAWQDTMDNADFRCCCCGGTAVGVCTMQKGCAWMCWFYTQHAFLEATLFHVLLGRKDAWWDMAHSVVKNQARVRWVGCNDIVVQTHFCVCQWVLRNAYIWHQMPSPTHWFTFHQHTFFHTHMWLPFAHERRVDVVSVDT